MSALVLALALLSPADFRMHAEIATTSKDALHRVAVPFEAYRDGRRDFADLRVFNAAGEALPVAFAGEADATRTEPPPVALSMFPVTAEAQAKAAAGNLDVVVKSNADGTIVSVQGRAANTTKPAPHTVAWLLDASKIETPIHALVVDWDAGPGTEIVRVSVDASDDLKTWRRIVSQSQLVHLEQGGMKLEQRRIDVTGLKAKYLRVFADSGAFALKSVEALRDDTVTPAPRVTRAFQAAAGAKPGEYLFDLGARIPVEAVRVVVPANTVAPFTIATREVDSGPWMVLTSATFYRLTREGAELESRAVEVRRTARYVSIQLDARAPALANVVPVLEVQWRPAQVVFVARGDGPYMLAAGNREAERTILAVSQLMPDYKPGAELKIPEDKIVRVTATTKTESPLESVVGEDVDQRKAVLWGVLLLGVAVLAWMAWRLGRQMSGGGGPGKA